MILNWLRYKEILGKGVDPDDVIPVADYFGLPKLIKKLKALKNPDVSQNNNISDIIRLKIGGTIFEITRAILTKTPDSKLARMFTPGSETSPPLTEDGAYLIDASARAAEVVINWLRDGRPCPGRWIHQHLTDGNFQENLVGCANRFFIHWESSCSGIRFRYLI